MTDRRRFNVVLGVGGGIAAYKACELLRRFTEAGHDVRVLPTEAALRFVGAPTWEALSGKPVRTDIFSDVEQVPHVRIGQSADLVFVAPATADLLAKAATGQADDLLTNTLLTARCPVVFAPAMHTEMWEHPATQSNIATLRERGAIVIDPDSGRLTGADTGPGRLPDPQRLFSFAEQLLDHGSYERDLVGQRMLISAGGTREYLDPVRFLGNRSSGRQGVALAETALARGASVTLVGANLRVSPPAGVELVTVETTGELRDAMVQRATEADAVVMAAAPVDFRPADQRTSKIKKQPDGAAPSLDLVENPDILAELVSSRRSKQPFIVGFAAETGDDTGSVLEHGRAKLERKGCDLLVVNDVSAGRVFDRAENEAVLLGSDGTTEHVPFGPKTVLAHAIWDAALRRLTS